MTYPGWRGGQRPASLSVMPASCWEGSSIWIHPREVTKMPELPDVQVYKEYLDATSLHHEVTRVSVGDDRILEGVSARSLTRAMKGHAFEKTHRHGKHLFVRIGEGGWLHVHFGMTGGLRYYKKEDKKPEHSRVVVGFENGFHLALVSQRLLREYRTGRRTRGLHQGEEAGPGRPGSLVRGVCGYPPRPARYHQERTDEPVGDCRRGQYLLRRDLVSGAPAARPPSRRSRRLDSRRSVAHEPERAAHGHQGPGGYRQDARELAAYLTAARERSALAVGAKCPARRSPAAARTSVRVVRNDAFVTGWSGAGGGERIVWGRRRVAQRSSPCLPLSRHGYLLAEQIRARAWTSRAAGPVWAGRGDQGRLNVENDRGTDRRPRHSQPRDS